jgi:hypothetical protein
VFPVSTKDVVAVLDLLEDGIELGLESAVQAHTKGVRDFVRGQAPQAHLATALEELVDGKVAVEDEVAAVFDLAMA